MKNLKWWLRFSLTRLLLRQVGAQVADYYKQAFRKIESSNSKADSLTAEETIAEVVGSKLSKAWTKYVRT